VKHIYRQGDVGIVPVARIPKKDAAPVARVRGRIVLAEGEVTGHAHVITDEGATLIRSSDGRTFLRLDAPAVVRHEEHAPITLPKGGYEVRIQREWTDADEPRRVTD